MTPQERWLALVAWAAERGVDEPTITDWIILGERRGGCGWLWWSAEKGISAELDLYLRRRVERMAKIQGIET